MTSRGAGKSVDELKDMIKDFKAHAMTLSSAAGSGHVGGAMSSAEWLITSWFDKLNINPGAEDRDRFFIGQGHITPGIAALLAMKGYYTREETASYRRYASPFQAHPDINLKGWEMCSGSLGQALGVAAGCALAAKIRGQKHRIVTLNSDGELMEGSMWEAIMYAGAHGLDNLITFFDFNRIQNYSRIDDTNELEPLADKLRAFNWEVVEIDGNDIEQLMEAYDTALVPDRGKPFAIVGHTKIGKGVSFMEDVVVYHSKAPPRDKLGEGIKELGSDFPYEEVLAQHDAYTKRVAQELSDKDPKFSKDYSWKSGDDMQIEEVWTGIGITEMYKECMDSDPNVIVCTDDSHKLIGLTDDDKKHYTERNQYTDVGCAEQNMAQVAAGLAKEGFIPLTQGYTCFSMGRAYDHIRTSIAFPNFNVKYFPTEGLLGGDGAMHESLEGITLGYYLPNMRVQWPADVHEAKKATKVAIHGIKGPIATLQERAPKPVISKVDTAYEHGVANIIRFTGRQPMFVDAFETTLSTKWTPENNDVAIIACGSQVSEAMRAAVILKEEKDVETTVVNLHTIKPLDTAGILKALQGAKVVIATSQDHEGALGNIVAGAIMEAGLEKTPKFKKMGVDDEFGQTAKPYELVQHYGLTAEHIAETAIGLLGA
jgi:transketolase